MADSDFRAPHLRNQDFLGTFAWIERGEGDHREVLLVGNERRVHGKDVETWDLPGGQVEPGELVVEALRRELQEEISVDVGDGAPEFLFVQDGERRDGDVRKHAWRSVFFAVQLPEGAEPKAGAEVRGLRWKKVADMPGRLVAPYHDSLKAWLEGGKSGTWVQSVWEEQPGTLAPAQDS